MGIISVLVAAAAAWIFGAVWYMAISKQWMAASRLTEADVNQKDPAPYIVSFIAVVLVAGMTRHILAMGGLHGGWSGFMTGLGLGAFVAAPWVATNVMFSVRSKSLIWMDGTYVVVGCAIIGLVLGLFN